MKRLLMELWIMVLTLYYRVEPVREEQINSLRDRLTEALRKIGDDFDASI